jgi:transcriptional regulator with XRE-family HTH domain
MQPIKDPKMSTNEPEKKDAIRPSGRRYSSIPALMKGEDIPGDVQILVRELSKDTCITRQLASMRLSRNLSQEQMAEKIGCTQSCVSKWESGRDEDLTLKIIRDYAQETNHPIGISFGPAPNHVESVKAHAFCIRDHMLELAKLAHVDEEMEKEIHAFFGEAAFNILTILGKCHNEMPEGTRADFEVRLQVSEPNPKSEVRRRARRAVGELAPIQCCDSAFLAGGEKPGSDR